VLDKELADAKVHLSLVSGILDSIIEVVSRLHVGPAVAVIYAAWPELRDDVEKLIADLSSLLAKLRTLG
jgi:hypothetical protein